ncbi:MAG: ribosomal L7Ae/L30e/S12e/Gadd45 family protein [Syntrophomonadaceae bacterium]|nr:ribosomal L7Ae/L30e/S12e/Gadd45 family protein [Syntrophomonadaceae bacterium]
MKKVYSLIGIAQRAGKASSGVKAAAASIMKNQARMLLMSKDIALNSQDLLLKYCMKHNIPWITLGSRYDIGDSIGKEYRVAVTINDAGIADAIMQAVTAAGMEAESMGVDEWQK